MHVATPGEDGGRDAHQRADVVQVHGPAAHLKCPMNVTAM